MAHIVLYCEETPGLKLGPESEIVFSDGYADVDTEQYPNWSDWAFHRGTPFIRVLDEGEATSATAAAGGFACGNCGKTFTEQKKLNGHLLSHRPRPKK